MLAALTVVVCFTLVCGQGTDDEERGRRARQHAAALRERRSNQACMYMIVMLHSILHHK